MLYIFQAVTYFTYNLHRYILLFTAAVTQLPCAVPAPGPNSAVAAQSQVMVETSAYLFYILKKTFSLGPLYLDSFAAGRCRANTELAPVACSPAPDCPVLL